MLGGRASTVPDARAPASVWGPLEMTLGVFPGVIERGEERQRPCPSLGEYGRPLVDFHQFGYTCISREVLGQRERVTRQALEELEMMAGHWVKHLYKS